MDGPAARLTPFFRTLRVAAMPSAAARSVAVVATFTLAIAMSGCGRGARSEAPPSGETFGAEDTYSRVYPVAPAVACEAVRRALLGQGYVIGRMAGDALEASKSFQPDDEIHTQLNVRATCVPRSGGDALVFVNAVQDRYALKSQANQASVGVGVFGSVSVPIGSSNANLVRVASNTVQNQDFYRRFFERVKFYLPNTPGEAPMPARAPEREPEEPPDPAPAVPEPTSEAEPTEP